MDRVDYESIVIQDLENFYKGETLDLAPWYQRRSVWTPPQKAYLINSLFEGKPIPTCYIRHYLDIENEKSIKEVVDGQQRLRTILEYLNGEFGARVPGRPGLITYKQLTPKERAKLRMTKLSVGYLIGATDADVIDIFGRLNSVSKQLNDQEKRNARHSGAMKQFCLRMAAMRVDFWRAAGIFSATEISRMAEVRFVSDLVLNLISGPSDYSPARLDKLYAENDEDFALEYDVEKRFSKVFDICGELEEKTFNDTIFSRAPLFFSLFLLVDEKNIVKVPALRRRIKEVDAAFSNPDVPVDERSKADQEFYLACTSSTQRAKNRAIRREYLINALF